MEMGLFEECQSRIEVALNRTSKNSQPLTPEFVAEVKAILNIDEKVKIRMSKKSAPTSLTGIGEEGEKIVGAKTRGRKIAIRSDQIIGDEVDLKYARKDIPNSIVRQCLEEAVQRKEIEPRAIAKRFSMMMLQTKKRVYRFKTSDFFQMCYLATPVQELLFEKRLKELTGGLPEQGNVEAEGETLEGRLVVEESSGKYSLNENQTKNNMEGKKEKRKKIFWMTTKRTRKAPKYLLEGTG